MDIIRNKIVQNVINDSEIIRDIEHEKRKDPKFDINLGCSEYNCSLLIRAVLQNRKDLVEYLLSSPDINVNHIANNGNTVLYACIQVSILKLFLNRKDLVVVNTQNIWGETELHSSCWWGRKACVRELLLDARVNTYIRDDRGKMPQDYALKRGYPGIAKIIGNSGRTSLLRIPNASLLHDIVRMIIEEYV